MKRIPSEAILRKKSFFEGMMNEEELRINRDLLNEIARRKRLLKSGYGDSSRVVLKSGFSDRLLDLSDRYN